MYDTATRAALVKRRVRENIRRRRRREVGALSAACMLLSAAPVSYTHLTLPTN